MTHPDDASLPLPVARPAASASPVPRRRRRWLLVLLVPVLMFSGAVIGLYFQPPALRSFYALTGLRPGGGAAYPIALPPDIELPRDMAETMRATDVLGLARLLPRGDLSPVAAPYGAGDARLAEILVTEGARVDKGAVVARLDNHDVLHSAVLQAEAALAIREAALMQTRAAVQSSRDEAQATLDQMRAAAADATTQRQRTEELLARAAATRATLDAQLAAERQALAAVAKAEATLARFTTVALDDQPDVVVARRNLQAAQADLDRARRDIGRAEVLAPIIGTVLDITATPGARPPAEGIMLIGDTSVMMAEAEIWQDRISQVAVGQPVELASTALGRTFHGRVQSIGLIVGRQGLVADDTAANTDARVVRIMVALDVASSTQAAGFTNLEVIARPDPDPAPAGPGPAAAPGVAPGAEPGAAPGAEPAHDPAPAHDPGPGPTATTGTAPTPATNSATTTATVPAPAAAPAPAPATGTASAANPAASGIAPAASSPPASAADRAGESEAFTASATGPAPEPAADPATTGAAPAANSPPASATEAATATAPSAATKAAPAPATDSANTTTPAPAPAPKAAP
ncbi:MAG TPA: HlyD family efflux transporter periplasmic adaptor subunit [Paracoccus solventivorans]|uniref:HlyD family efflux transporter periplasmic adaptor subunit n=1 Tax=Paracoccus solventivorans TaxID=53463 RepID=UPI002BB8D067|nr:HlyD family efflux transporter periplasmic adaptor subunit [Paracoccus solventivorans]HMM09798.1 HlyD family efflux transporter periplasmic adaptor subunit [Paracoccus solventivorans]